MLPRCTSSTVHPVGVSTRLRKLFSSREGSSIPNHVAVRKVGAQRGEAYITKYWQNYDLSISEAPKLFSDAELDAAKRIRHGLEVFALRKRLQVRGILVPRQGWSSPKGYTQDQREIEWSMLDQEGRDEYRERAVHRPQALLRGLPETRLSNQVYASTGHPPSGQGQDLCSPSGHRKSLRVCCGRGHQRAEPEKNGERPAVHHRRGFKPRFFYFDSFGVLRRVTSSIFDERGNTAQREKARRQWQERFIARQEGTNARREALFSSPETSARPDDLPDDGPS